MQGGTLGHAFYYTYTKVHIFLTENVEKSAYLKAGNDKSHNALNSFPRSPAVMDAKCGQTRRKVSRPKKEIVVDATMRM